jgi:hypothetical protein
MNDIYRLLLQVFRIFLATQAPEYRAGLMLWLLHIEFLKASQHPGWKLLSVCPSLLNEEPCEISLSHLARLHWTTSVRSSPDLLSFHYRLLPSAIRVRNAFMPEYHASSSSVHCIPDDAKEVNTTATFMESLIRRLEAGQFTHYLGTPGAWTSAMDADKVAGNQLPESYLPEDEGKQFDEVLRRLKKTMATPFCMPFADLLPDHKTLFQSYRGPNELHVTEDPPPEELSDQEAGDLDFLEPEIFSTTALRADDEDLLEPCQVCSWYLATACFTSFSVSLNVICVAGCFWGLTSVFQSSLLRRET